MAFMLKSGSYQIAYVTRKESVTYTAGDLVYWLASDPGYAIPADATAGNFAGVALFSIDSSDSNYATTNEKFPIAIPNEDAEWEADVSGTLATTKVGEYWDLAYAGTVNAAATAKNVVLCTGYISTSKGLFKINATAYNAHVTVS